jgi:hypothetical protein
VSAAEKAERKVQLRDKVSYISHSHPRSHFIVECQANQLYVFFIKEILYSTP